MADVFGAALFLIIFSKNISLDVYTWWQKWLALMPYSKITGLLVDSVVFLFEDGMFLVGGFSPGTPLSTPESRNMQFDDYDNYKYE